MQSHEQFMQIAIDKAEEGIEKGQTPFGSVIVHRGNPIAISHNTVWNDCDPSAHAEVNAIRVAAKKLQTIDLSGCQLYTTCEPCPMCLSAIHWAKIDCVIFGATIQDAKDAGFSELELPAQDMVSRGGSALVVEKGPLQQQCADLFQKWKTAGKSQRY